VRTASDTALANCRSSAKAAPVYLSFLPDPLPLLLGLLLHLALPL
jgi:hypothetical protein